MAPLKERSHCTLRCKATIWTTCGQNQCEYEFKWRRQNVASSIEQYQIQFNFNPINGTAYPQLRE